MDSTRRLRLTFGVDRVERGVEGFFRNGKLGHPHRRDALRAHKQRQRRLHGCDLQRARRRQRLAGEQGRRARIDQRLEHRQARRDAGGDHVGVLVGEFEAIGRVDVGLQPEGLDRRPLQPQRLGAIRPLAGALHLQATREFFGVVLQRDHPAHLRRGRLDQHDAAFDDTGTGYSRS